MTTGAFGEEDEKNDFSDWCKLNQKIETESIGFTKFEEGM